MSCNSARKKPVFRIMKKFSSEASKYNLERKFHENPIKEPETQCMFSNRK